MMCDNYNTDNKKYSDGYIPNSKCPAQNRLNYKKKLIQIENKRIKLLINGNSSSKKTDKFDEIKRKNNSNKNKSNPNVIINTKKYEEIKRKNSTLDDYNNSSKNKSIPIVYSSRLANQRLQRAIKPKFDKSLPQTSNHVKNKLENVASRSSKYTSEKINKKIESKITLNNEKEEEMDWETKDSEILILNIQNLRNENPKIKNDNTYNSIDCSLDIDKNKLYLVLDTNVLLSDLQKISHLKGKKLKDIGEIIFFIPWRVIQELDMLKKNFNKQLAFKSIKAIDFLFNNFKSKDPYLKGQSAMNNVCNLLMTCDVPDDQILNSCLQIKSENNLVVLLTNDKNLINKSLMNNIPSFITNELLKEITETSTLKITNKEVCKIEPIDQELYKFENNLKKFLFEVLNNEIRSSIGDNWLNLDHFKEMTWTLTNIFEIIVKYWHLFSHIFTPEEITRFKEIVYYFSPETALSKHLKMERIIQASLSFLSHIKQFQNSKLDNHIKNLIQNYNLTITEVTTIKNNFDFNKILPIYVIFQDIHNSIYNYCESISNLEPKPYLNPYDVSSLPEIYDKMANITIFINDIRGLINSILCANDDLGFSSQVINRLYNLLQYYSNPNPLNFDINQLVLFCSSKEIREKLKSFVIQLIEYETIISNVQNKIKQI